MEYEKSIKIKRNQFLAVQMLATGKSGKAVAEALNVAPETISRWQQLPQFKSHLNAALWDLKRATGKRLVSLIATAVDAITSAFNDPNMSTHDKFIMGIKFLELCAKHNIEIKTRID